MSVRLTRGFTLLEVMVALLIFGLVAASVVKGMQLSAEAQTRLFDRTLATAIAQNEMATLRLSNQVPAISVSKSSLDFGGRQWEVVTNIKATDDKMLVRADIDVHRVLDTGKRQKTMTYVGFIGKVQ